MLHPASFLRLLSCLACMVLSCAAFSQELAYRNYRVKDGLPSTEVYHVIQDHLGYIWIATDAGVSRFDGYDFQNFTTKEGLSDNTVFGLYEDHRGRIWFRPMSGKLCYYDEGRIHIIPAADTLSKIIGSTVIGSMYVDAQDTLWVGCESKGSYRIAPGYRAEHMQKIKREDGFHIRLRPEGMIYTYNELDRPFVPRFAVDFYGVLSEHEVEIENGTPHLRAHMSEDRRVLVSYGQALFEFRDGRIVQSCKLPRAILGLHRDRQGNVWAGLYDGGLLLFSGGRFEPRYRRHFFANDPIGIIAEDHEGGLWLASLKNGIYYLPNSAMVNYSELSFVPDNKIFAIEEVNDEIWAGNNNGDIWRLRPDSMIIWDSAGPVGTVTDNAVLAMRMVGSKLYVGARRSFTYDAKTARTGPLNFNEALLLKFFDEPHDGKMWSGSFSFLNRIDLQNDHLVERVEFPYSRINHVMQAGDTLWLACVNGLWSYAGGRFTHVGAGDPLLSRRLDHIVDLGGGKLGFATKEAGVLIWDRKRVRQITTRDGLASDFCRYLLPTGNTLWVATNRGVSGIDMSSAQLRIRNIGIGQGLISEEVNQLCFSRGKLWVATSSGVSSFDTAAQFANDTPPPVYITGVYAAERRFSLGERPTLTHDENTVAFQFVGLSFRNAGAVKYRYRLEGLDTAWSLTSTPEVRFTTLPPGDYVFSVYALNNDGLPSAKPATWQFTVSPPFWATWWFILFCAAGLFLLGGGIVFMRVRTQQRREREKAKLDQQVTEMEMKALRAQMNPHFIFNVIGSIQHFILTNDNRSANKYLVKFSRLIRSVLENTKSDMISLRQEIDSLRLYIELESLRFETHFEYEIGIDDSVDDMAMQIPPMLLQPYVENAIWHGLLPKREGEVRLLVSLRVEDGLLHCVIDDNGVGREVSAGMRQPGNERRSFGMEITADRLKALSHLYGKRLDVSVIDKYDEKGRPAGTRVELRLPKIRKET